MGKGKELEGVTTAMFVCIGSSHRKSESTRSHVSHSPHTCDCLPSRFSRLSPQCFNFLLSRCYLLSATLPLIRTGIPLFPSISSCVSGSSNSISRQKEKKRIHHIVIHNISGIYVRMFLDIGYSNVRLTF